MKNVVLKYSLESPEELSIFEESPASNLKNLENNFSSGASKNLFGSINYPFQICISSKDLIISSNDNNKKDFDYGSKASSFDGNFKIPIINIIENHEFNINEFENFSSNSSQKSSNEKFNYLDINLCKTDIHKKSIKYNKNSVKTHPFKNIVFNQNISNETFYSYLEYIHEALKYIKEKLREPNIEIFLRKSVILDPIRPKPKTLFFALNNVLISQNNNVKRKTSDFIIETNDSQENISNFLKLRPFCIESLKKLSKYYEIYLFTHNSQKYTNQIMEFMDPHKLIFNGALSYKHCFRTQKDLFIKDLRIIKNKNLNEMLIVDKSVYSFAFQIENGIPILPWNNDQKDCELKHLTKYLIKLSKFDNLRRANSDYFKLSEIQKKTMNELIIF